MEKKLADQKAVQHELTTIDACIDEGIQSNTMAETTWMSTSKFVDVGTQCNFYVKAKRDAEVQTVTCVASTNIQALPEQPVLPKTGSPATETHVHIDHNYCSGASSAILNSDESNGILNERSYFECRTERIDSGEGDIESDVMSIDDPNDRGDDSDYECPSSVPSSDCESESSESDKPTSVCAERKKYVVFESELYMLFHHCTVCGSVVTEREKSEKGSMITIKAVCLNGHVTSWNSQPVVKNVPAGNLLIPAAILYSGITYSYLQSFANTLNLKILSEKHFYRIQRKYLFPVVNQTWKDHQREVFNGIKSKKSIDLCGDGRCDSPGHSAKYGTYTLMEESSKKIVQFSLVQVSEVSSSNAMEYEGCKRSLDMV